MNIIRFEKYTWLFIAFHLLFLYSSSFFFIFFSSLCVLNSIRFLLQLKASLPSQDINIKVCVHFLFFFKQIMLNVLVVTAWKEMECRMEFVALYSYVCVIQLLFQYWLYFLSIFKTLTKKIQNSEAK